MNREPRISKTVAEESDPVTTRQMVCRKYNVMRFEAYSLAIVGALALTRHRYAINKIAQTEKDGGGGKFFEQTPGESIDESPRQCLWKFCKMLRNANHLIPNNPIASLRRLISQHNVVVPFNISV